MVRTPTLDLVRAGKLLLADCMKTAAALIVKMALILTALPALTAQKREGLHPHLVLPLSSAVTEEQAQCLSLIEAAEIRFCPGADTKDGSHTLEVFMRQDYRGEFGVRDDRGPMLDAAHDRVVGVCGLSMDFTKSEFRGIVGTPLTALGTESLKQKTHAVLEITSQYYFGMDLKSVIESGQDMDPRSRCQQKAFLGM